MSLAAALAEKQAERAALVQQAGRLLREDSRIVAAWLAGSLGREEGDAYSYVDLWVVVDDAYMKEIGEGRREYAALLGEPVLLSEAPQNAPAGGAYLWALYPGKHGPQHVDWNWLPQSTAAIPPDTRLLFDKSSLPLSVAHIPERPTGDELASALTQECAFFWGMSTVVAKYIARGKTYEALNLLNIAGDALTKAKWLLGTGTRMTYRDNIWDPASPPFTGPEQVVFLRVLTSNMHSMHAQVEAEGGQVPTVVIGQVLALFDLAEQGTI